MVCVAGAGVGVGGDGGGFIEALGVKIASSVMGRMNRDGRMVGRERRRKRRFGKSAMEKEEWRQNKKIAVRT